MAKRSSRTHTPLLEELHRSPSFRRKPESRDGWIVAPSLQADCFFPAIFAHYCQGEEHAMVNPHAAGPVEKTVCGKRVMAASGDCS